MFVPQDGQRLTRHALPQTECRKSAEKQQALTLGLSHVHEVRTVIN